MTDDPTVQMKESRQALEAAIAENKGWFMIVGILLTLLGVIAIGAPFVATLAVKILIGWLLLIGGVMLIAHAFVAEGWQGVLGSLLIGLLYVVAGGWLVFEPLAGLITLTVLLALMFLFEGAVKLGLGFRFRPAQGWGWIVANGVLALLLGVMLILDLPGSATWAIGLLVGINLLVSGMVMIMLGASPAPADQ